MDTSQTLRITDYYGNVLAEFPRPQSDFLNFTTSDEGSLNSLKFVFSGSTCHGLRFTFDSCQMNNLVFEGDQATMLGARFIFDGMQSIDYSRVELKGVDRSKLRVVVGMKDPVDPIVPIAE